MTITTTIERPSTVFMNKTEYIRKGEWDVTGLSKDELIAKLDKSYEKAREDVSRGNGVTANEFFQKFKKDHREWFTV